MSRKLYLTIGAVVALHVLVALTLRGTTLASFFGNSLQTLSAILAAAFAIRAALRSSNATRAFWILVAGTMTIWALGNVGWTYYEVVQHSEPPVGSVFRFLFNTQCLFLAMALSVDQDRESGPFDLAFLIDSIQMAIVFSFIFLGLYLVPSLHANPHAATIREVWVEMGENALLLVIAIVQILRARRPQLRKLYAHFALFIALYMLGAAIDDLEQSIAPLSTGTLFDLTWSFPLLYVAAWASQWKGLDASPPDRRERRKTFGEMVFSNATFAFAPLLVLILQVSQADAGWRILRFSLLGISILCFAVRLAVSESREAESAASVSRATLAMDSTLDGMAIIGRDGNHVYVNTAFLQMMGHSQPSALLGKPWQSCYSPADISQMEPQIRASLREHGKWFGALTVHRPDSTTLAIELAVTMLPDGGVVCISRDVSDRESLQAARAETEAKYRALVEQVNAISYIGELGIGGAWTYVSPQVENILGFTPEEWLFDSCNWLKHVPAEDHNVIEASEVASSKGDPYQAEYRITRKDGRVIWVSDTAVVVRNKDGHPRMEGIIVDITDRKALENQLQQSRRMEAVGRLAGGIAHDFNNLLTIVKGYAELALNRPNAPADISADVRQIDDAAERASALVRQLLAFSRKQVLQPRAIDLNSIVLGLDKLLRRLMGEHIEMITHCSTAIGIVKADPAQVEQVLMNLVVNARDAMPNGGRLTVETSNVELDATYAREHVTVKPGSYVMLAVSDTGIGMDADTQAHIFEPFYTTKGGGHGTGLGLSTVYGIVKQSGGYIWVYSESGRGSSFKVYLPRVDSPADSVQPASAFPVSRKGHETILLVEDEEAVRELSRVVLAAEGYNVIVAENAARAEALAAAIPGELHLLLTDVVMPGSSGGELAQRIAARSPNTRVLFMSGYTDNVIAQGGVLEAGVAFLQKPFTPRALAAKVRDVLDATPVPVKITV